MGHLPVKIVSALVLASTATLHLLGGAKMPREYKMYMNGEWVSAQDGEVYDDLNPYTGEVFARVASGKRIDAKRAIDAAAAAFPAWSHTLPAERQALFLRAADILEKKQNEIISILGEETGCTFGLKVWPLPSGSNRESFTSTIRRFMMSRRCPLGE
jgi:delta 1-pyrroline-5-carboxylate dehydrogenase